ncbi:MAG: membrane protein insertion efficiency factor YidD [Elusimicrobia bacterium]|nr:membrane protein insertion efficiency factor YidD [Elusimicrobiota bacterium]
MAKFLCHFFRLYQGLFRPLLPRACRFHPSCSDYAIEAVQKYGAAKGSWLSFRRILKCSPLHPGGYDPVR